MLMIHLAIKLIVVVVVDLVEMVEQNFKCMEIRGNTLQVVEEDMEVMEAEVQVEVEDLEVMVEIMQEGVEDMANQHMEEKVQEEEVVDIMGMVEMVIVEL